MKKALMVMGVAVLAVGLLFWAAVSFQRGPLVAGNQVVHGAVAGRGVSDNVILNGQVDLRTSKVNAGDAGNTKLMNNLETVKVNTIETKEQTGRVVSVRAPIALMDQGLASGTAEYLKIEPDEVFTITAPRYRPEEEGTGRLELMPKTPAQKADPSFLGEYRATIRCGKKCRKPAVKRR